MEVTRPLAERPDQGVLSCLHFTCLTPLQAVTWKRVKQLAKKHEVTELTGVEAAFQAVHMVTLVETRKSFVGQRGRFRLILVCPYQGGSPR